MPEHDCVAIRVTYEAARRNGSDSRKEYIRNLLHLSQNIRLPPISSFHGRSGHTCSNPFETQPPYGNISRPEDAYRNRKVLRATPTMIGQDIRMASCLSLTALLSRLSRFDRNPPTKSDRLLSRQKPLSHEISYLRMHSVPWDPGKDDRL